MTVSASAFSIWTCRSRSIQTGSTSSTRESNLEHVPAMPRREQVTTVLKIEPHWPENDVAATYHHFHARRTGSGSSCHVALQSRHSSRPYSLSRANRMNSSGWSRRTRKKPATPEWRSLIVSTEAGCFANSMDAAPQNGSTYVRCGGMSGFNLAIIMPLPPYHQNGARDLANVTPPRCRAETGVYAPQSSLCCNYSEQPNTCRLGANRWAIVPTILR